MVMAEGGQAHLQAMDRGRMVYAFAGLAFGFFALVVDLALSAYLAIHDKALVASLLLGVPVVGAIGWFVQARLPANSGQAPSA